jgi:osmotically-inducible protein OsmY
VRIPLSGHALATLLGMKRKYFSHLAFSHLALASQLFVAAAGLSLAAPAQDKDGQPTADQQKSNKPDRELTQKIRKAVVADKSLSVSAHNVKIITRDGMVTLRGTVKSDDEKKSIEDKATEIAGQGKVTSELTVTP